MNKIYWKKVEGYTIHDPEVDEDWSTLKIRMPYGFPELVLMPGDDALIPTGLWFPGVYREFMIIPVHHTYPNKESDVCEVWNGKIKSDFPVLHMSIVSDRSQVYIHVINLGKTELRYGPGKVVSYFMFTPLIKEFGGEEEDD